MVFGNSTYFWLTVKKPLYHFLKQSRIRFIDYIILIIMAIIPIRSIGLTGVWNKTDLDFPFYPIDAFYKSIFLWDHSFYTGYDTSTSSILIEQDRSLLLAFLSSLNLSAGFVERVFLILVFGGMLFGMYYLVTSFSFNRNVAAPRIAGLIASCFYLYNPYVILRLYYGNLPYLEAMAIFPFTIAFYYRAHKCGENRLPYTKYVILSSLTSIVLLSSNHPTSFLILLWLAFYWLAWILKCVITHNYGSIKIHVWIGLSTLGLSVLLNLWWLLPIVSGIFGQNILRPLINPNLPGGLQYVQEQLRRESNIIEPFAAVRLQLFGERPRFVPVYWDSWINNPWMSLIGFALLVLSMFPILLKPKNKHIVFFTVAHIFSISALMGSKTIIGDIWLFLVDRSAVFAILTSFNKAGTIAAINFAILIGITSSEIFLKMNKDCSPLKKKLRIKKKIMLIGILSFIVSLIAVNSLPMLSGNLDYMLKPVQVPNYYVEARDWFKDQSGDYRILVLPRTNFLDQYKWFGYYDMVDVTTGIFPKPVIADRPGWDSSLYLSDLANTPEDLNHIGAMKIVLRALNKGETEYFGKMISIFNVKYIVLRGDLSDTDISGLRAKLLSQKDISLIKIFGSIEIYENESFDLGGLLYGSSSFVEVKGFNSLLPFLTTMQRIIPNETKFVFVYDSLISNQERSKIQKLGQNITVSTKNITIPINVESVKGDNVDISFSDNDSNNQVLMAKSVARRGSWATTLINLSKVQFENKDEKILFFEFKFENDKAKDLEFGIDDQEKGTRTWRYLDLVTKPGNWIKIELPLNDKFWYDNGFNQNKISQLFIRAKESDDNDSQIRYSIRNLSLGVIRADPYIPSKKDFLTSWTSANPTKYAIMVNASRPIILVFSETFSNGWNARIKGDSRELTHIIVNGYANGWYISKTGLYEVSLEYEPNNYLLLGQITSGLTLAFVMLKYSKMAFNETKEQSKKMEGEH